MNVKLTWTDGNTDETGHRIYRSSNPMDTQALPPPVAELDPNVTEWEDTDTPVDQEVYYIVSAVRGVDEAFSDETMIDTTHSAPLPTVIGEAFGGGFYAGDIEYPDGQWYKLIVADVSSDITAKWKTELSVTPGADRPIDGVSNTNDVVAAGIELHPAAEHCVNHLGGGFEDWYLPAIDELEVIYQNLGFNQPDCPPEFEAGGPQAFVDVAYWSSTQYSTPELVVTQLFNYGGQNNIYMTQSIYRARPVRRVPFAP